MYVYMMISKINDHLDIMHLRIITMHVVVSFRRDQLNISLGEMIGHTWEEYFFYIWGHEFMKSGDNVYKHIGIGHILH